MFPKNDSFPDSVETLNSLPHAYLDSLKVLSDNGYEYLSHEENWMGVHFTFVKPNMRVSFWVYIQASLTTPVFTFNYNYILFQNINGSQDDTIDGIFDSNNLVITHHENSLSEQIDYLNGMEDFGFFLNHSVPFVEYTQDEYGDVVTGNVREDFVVF